jgi:hypothetical protein
VSLLVFGYRRRIISVYALVSAEYEEQNSLSIDIFWGQPQTPWFRFAEGVEK